MGLRSSSRTSAAYSGQCADLLSAQTKTAKRRPGAHRSHAHAALAAWPTPPLRADIPRLRVGCGLHIPYALRGVAPKDVCACEDHNPTPLPPRQGPPPDYAGWETVEVTA